LPPKNVFFPTKSKNLATGLPDGVTLPKRLELR